MPRRFLTPTLHILLIACLLASTRPLPAFVPVAQASQATAGFSLPAAAPTATPTAYDPYPILPTPTPTPTPTPVPLTPRLALTMHAAPAVVGPGDLLTYTIALWRALAKEQRAGGRGEGRVAGFVLEPLVS